MTGGYVGKTLWVDLSRGELREEHLDDRLCRDFLGGYGIGARVLFNHVPAGTDPLGEHNLLGFITGPLAGTPVLGGSRYTVVAKSPLTGGWGDANSGGWFGPYLKFSGYDAIYFSGISEKPVYLRIDNGKPELKDASLLWGKDTFETEDALKAQLGRDTEVACIGPSGEKLSLIAAVMNNKGRAAGRSGLGAVMGSKRLKAVTVRGNMRVPLANESGAQELRRKYLRELTGHVTMLKEFGTPGIMLNCALTGDAPVKNWGGVVNRDFSEIEPIAGPAVIARRKNRYACYQCPIACGGHMEGATGEYPYEAGGHKPEYETLAMFGTNCLNSDLESIIKCNDLCNRYGMDSISTGAAVAMAIECYENGILSRGDTDGLEMTWGNHAAIVALTEKISKREGVGGLFADGVKVAAEKIGRGADRYAIHIQGQELPGHDPKFGLHWAIAYHMDPTPARHTQGPGRHPPGLPIPAYDKQAQLGRQPGHKLGHSFNHVVQCLGLCTFVYSALPHVDAFMEQTRAVTGWDVTVEEFFQTGERITNIRQAFNIREGLNPLKFHVPDRVAGKPPFQEGPSKGITLDEGRMDREYLEAMDWDPVTARPSQRKLEELGLEDVSRVLWH